MGAGTGKGLWLDCSVFRQDCDGKFESLGSHWGLRGTLGRAEVTGGGCIFDLAHVVFKEKEPIFGIGRFNLKISICSLS